MMEGKGIRESSESASVERERRKVCGKGEETILRRVVVVYVRRKQLNSRLVLITYLLWIACFTCSPKFLFTLEKITLTHPP